ncbi:hypothetical protein D3C86_1888930 [compost metagenome]
MQLLAHTDRYQRFFAFLCCLNPTRVELGDNTLGTSCTVMLLGYSNAAKLP